MQSHEPNGPSATQHSNLAQSQSVKLVNGTLADGIALHRHHTFGSASLAPTIDSIRQLAITFSMAAQQSQGIQTLLEAEKEAAKIVQKARTYRTQKLKDARSEASKEIEQLKSKKEKEFNDFQKEHEGSTSSSQTTVDKETEQKLEELNKAFESNRDEVIKKLLDRVVDVKTELHRNLQLQQKQQKA